MLRNFNLMAMLFAFTIFSLPTFAQDDAPPPAPEADAEEKKADIFEVPKGNDTKVLSIYLQKLARTPPKERNPESLLEHLTKMDKAVSEIMSRDIEEELFVNAAQIRLQVLGILPQFGDNTAVVKRTKMLDELKRDKRETVKAMVAQIELQEKISSLASMTEEQKKELISEIGAGIKNAKGDEATQGAVQAAMQVAQTLERYGDTANAVVAYKSYAEAIAGLSNPDLAKLSERMESTVRRLELPGNTIDIAGPTVSGGDYDIADMKGKVVLVDFWATWCGPCIAELPNVKTLYDAYNEKGFDVIGISLDDDVDRLATFIEDRDLKWETIFYPEAEDQGWNNPIARHYGISGIPTAILVNQEGKVVSLRARGENLKEELEKLLGPIEKVEEEETEEKKEE